MNYAEREQVGQSQTEVFAHEVCDGSARDEDERKIFLAGSLLTRKNR